MEARGDPGAELRLRLAKALNKCKALRPSWATKPLPKLLAARVFRSCVFSGLIYCLHTVHFEDTWANRIDALHIRCLRMALGIRTAYASNVIGEAHARHREVCQTRTSHATQRRHR